MNVHELLIMQVIYPGLVSHPNHAVATSQVRTQLTCINMYSMIN